MSAGAPAVAPAAAPSPSLCAALLALLGALAYAGTLHGPFIFDDKPGIVENEAIRHVWPPWHAGLSPHRIAVAFTFALNHAAGGLDPFGYHLANTAIHILAGLLLFDIVRRTLARQRPGPEADALGAAAAALWLVHPLQTQAVTYVSQRYESLMGLFVLLALNAFIRAAAGPRRSWALVAVAAAALAMCSKENALVAPALILLYDLAFLAASPRELLARRWEVHAALWCTIAAPYALRPLVPPDLELYGKVFGPLGVSAATYALTQLQVVAHYLRLALWPAGLCFDYGWPPVASAAQALLPGALLALLAALTVAAWRCCRGLGFLGAWFFIALAPTSSVVPVDDFCAEHRMYLPLAAVTTAAALAGWWLLRAAAARGRLTPGAARRAGVVALALALAVLTAATLQRNRVYRSALELWRDVLAKRPAHTRAYAGTGAALLRDGNPAAAAAILREGLTRLPDLTGVVYKLERRGTYTYAQRLGITDGVQLHNNLGVALLTLGETNAALREFEAALTLYPDDESARRNLALVGPAGPDAP